MSNVKQELTEYLRELQLPAIRRCFEEKARSAERETLSYEQYLRELAEQECQERRQNRIQRLLQASKLPLIQRASLPSYFGMRADPALDFPKFGNGLLTFTFPLH